TTAPSVFAVSGTHPIPPLFPYTTLFRSLFSISAWAQDMTQQAGQNDRAQMREQQRRRQEELNRRLNFTEEQKQQWILIQKQTARSEEHTSELQSPDHLVCRLLLEKKKKS